MYKFMPIYIQQGGLPGGYYLQMEPGMMRRADYVKEMYPKTFQRLQQIVDDECDRHEYSGSILYDEYPDRVGLMRMRNDIYDRVQMENTMCEEDMCQLYPQEDWLKDIIMVLLINEVARRKNKRNRFY